MGFLEDWHLTYEEIDELLTDNPSLRSFVAGYAAEMKCRRLWFDPSQHPVENVIKYDDHDRTKKGDIAFDYKGERFTVEVKSLQTNSIRERDGHLVATFQCDASDRRPVVFSDGSTVETTCLLVGEFDILAVALFGFYREWVFAFAKNEDLPRVSGLRGASKAYTALQLEALLATSMPMVDPPVAPYRMEPWSLLDELIEERARGDAPPAVQVVTGEQETLIVPEDD
ncbi:MAG: hypothetical protein QOG53_2668 [Frankiales bacterium]|nr:hypothetical protein [Frankiales bacterium]